MSASESTDDAVLPLTGCRVVEHSRGVAAAYAGRLLAAMGASVVMIEPPAGSPLRHAPPILTDAAPTDDATTAAAPTNAPQSALFAYLAAGKRSLVCDLASPDGRHAFERELGSADILIDDTPVHARSALGLDPVLVAQCFPSLVHASVLPFGAFGPKANWDGEEINLLHAGGEGFLLPNGYAQQLFPERPPLQIYGHFSEYQGGAMAAFTALSAWWAAPVSGGQYVDVSVQDAVLAVGAFALQRLGDGSLEHRSTRRFRYGGVFETRGGAFVELLTLEDRQWQGLSALLGNPAWSQEAALSDPLERSRRGDELNVHIREWMRQHDADDIVYRAQQLGVPIARYRKPEEIVNGEHERARGLFAPLPLDTDAPVKMNAQLLVAPFQFRCSPLAAPVSVPSLGELDGELCASRAYEALA